MLITFVCTGNICRSPMAEGLFRREAELRGAKVEVRSAGTWGNDGWEASGPAVTVLAEMEIDLAAHRARTLTAADLGDSDLVVVMTAVHQEDARALAEDAANKVRLLREFADIEAEAVAGEGPEERLASLLARTRPPYRREMEVGDPYGLPIQVYRRTAEDIAALVRHLADLLFGPNHGAANADP